jgi:hypothetical protein
MRERRFGARGTIHDGIFFTEESIEGGEFLGEIDIRIGRQNANLGDVKQALARKAKQTGATAVANFRYGQRKHGPMQLLNPFRWDTESWYGEGKAVKIDLTTTIGPRS